VLHNLAISRGLRSFVPDPAGNLSDVKVPGIAGRDKLQPVASGGLRDSYGPRPDAEAQAITGCLAGFLSKQQLKHFRTKRCRIRAHFGSLDNIGAAALTIGHVHTARGIVGGYQLKVDARHGVKCLSPASESYFLDRSSCHEPIHSVVWALAQLFMLHLESRRLTLFLCDAAVFGQCTGLTGGRSADISPATRAACRLLGAICDARVQSCVKGRFFDRMEAKLDQLARGKSSELVSVDMEAITTALAAAPANATQLGR
jgi:hypothetical protein